MARWQAKHLAPEAVDDADTSIGIVAACSSSNLRKGASSRLKFIAGTNNP